MLILGALKEVFIQQNVGGGRTNITVYLEPGKRAELVLLGDLKVLLSDGQDKNESVDFADNE
jgi:hypothetical protein